MNRKHFLKKGLLGLSAMAAVPALATPRKASTYDRLMEQVGFNHLPNQEIKTMKSVYHPAPSRGHAHHGWLESYHSFSFANYYNPERMNFGVLRVLNDDWVAPDRGFGRHPHDNMEIISIALSGALAHQDSMGNSHVIRTNDVQVMSAGTGIYHSEMNESATEDVRFLQIWVFPNKQDVKPRYDQVNFDPAGRHNRFQQVVSPDPEDEGVWIHQDAWFHLGQFDAGHSGSYTLNKPGNGLYLFVLEGSVQVGDQRLGRRDALGLWDTPHLDLTAIDTAEVLLMEVPMQI